MKSIYLNTLVKIVFLSNISFFYAQTSVPAQGSGTLSDPYKISSLNNLYWLSTTNSEWSSGKYFIQTADINAATSNSWNSGAGFSPIGNLTTRFYGNYDGQGHSVSNLYINRTTGEVGMFGFIQSGIVKNINFISPSITAGITSAYGFGILTGGAYLETIENIHITGGGITASVNGGSGFVAAIVGRTSTSTIKYCSSTANVSITSGSPMDIGGLVGLCESCTISFSNVVANVNAGTSSRVGGFMGEFYGSSSINSCYFNGNVTGGALVGGFVGNAYQGTVSNAFARGNITTSNYGSGGFVGFCQSTPSFVKCYTSVIMTNAYNSWRGGFGGYVENSTFTNCAYDNDVAGIWNVFGYDGSVQEPSAYTSTQLKDVTFMSSISYDLEGENTNGTEEYWVIDANLNNGYPFLLNRRYVWTGNTSSNWNTASNWSNGHVPIPKSNVVLTILRPNYPHLTSNTQVLNLFNNAGNMSTGTDTLIVGYSASEPGSIYGINYGYVEGTIKKYIPSTTSRTRFPLGDYTHQFPAVVSFTSAPTGGALVVKHDKNTDNDPTFSTLDDGGVSIVNVNNGHWHIEAIGGLSGGVYNVELATESIFGVTNTASLRVVKKSQLSDMWALHGTHLNGEGPNSFPTAKRTGLTGFSVFTIASPAENTLPATLIEFDVVKKENSQVEIHWTTSSEKNTSTYIVEHSLDNQLWEEIDELEAAGNSSVLLNYYSFDERPNYGINYYRIIQKDMDGKTEIYGPKAILIDNDLTYEAFPNPCVDFVQIKMNNVTEEIILTNIYGQKITAIEVYKIDEIVIINTNKLASGKYLISIPGKILSSFVKM